MKALFFSLIAAMAVTANASTLPCGARDNSTMEKPKEVTYSYLLPDAKPAASSAAVRTATRAGGADAVAPWRSPRKQ